MNGRSFMRNEIITRAHEKCEVCDSVEKIAIDIFRNDGKIKTRSQAGEHWVEVVNKNA